MFIFKQIKIKLCENSSYKFFSLGVLQLNQSVHQKSMYTMFHFIVYLSVCLINIRLAYLKMDNMIQFASTEIEESILLNI